MYTVVLLYSDGRQWLAGDFNTQLEVDRWIEAAEQQADWDSTTQIKITYAQRAPMSPSEAVGFQPVAPTTTIIPGDLATTTDTSTPTKPSILTRISNFFGFGQ